MEILMDFPVNLFLHTSRPRRARAISYGPVAGEAGETSGGARLLHLVAKRAFRGPGLQRFAAVPAEPRLGRVAGPEPRLDVRNAVVTPAVGSSRAGCTAGAPHGFAR